MQNIVRCDCRVLVVFFFTGLKNFGKEVGFVEAVYQIFIKNEITKFIFLKTNIDLGESKPGFFSSIAKQKMMLGYLIEGASSVK